MSYPPPYGSGYPPHPQYPQYPQPGAAPNQPPNPIPNYGFAPPPQQPYPSYPTGNAPSPYPYPPSPSPSQQQQPYPPTTSYPSVSISKYRSSLLVTNFVDASRNKFAHFSQIVFQLLMTCHEDRNLRNLKTCLFNLSTFLSSTAVVLVLGPLSSLSVESNPSQGGYPSVASAYPSYPGATSGGYPSAYQQPTSASGYPPSQHQHPSAASGYPPSVASTYPPPQQQQQQQQQTAPGYNYPVSSPSIATSTTSVSREPPKMGTVVEFNPFYPEEDAKALRKAMKGFGTDEKAIIDILDLIQDLKSELSGRFEDVTIALMTPTYDYLANRIHKAISGLGTDEEAIIDILCGASNQQIREINAAYLRLYRKPMEKDLIEDTSGHFRKLLVSLSMGNRNENPTPDPARAAQDAQGLYQAGAARWGTDEALFNSILVAQHFNQVRLVCSEYQRISGKSLENSIKSEFSGYVETGLLAIVKCAQNTPAYYAERLYRSMVGAGTDDRTLIRIVAVRSEIDMVQIKQEFQRMYGKTLESFIAGDTSGDYKKVLLGLV
uniref:Annexin n=1 Tax=Strigamia maritima TaxID=126957 RepID=T1IXK8_STRMM